MKRISPSFTFPGDVTRDITDFAITLFPLPDSPTIPTTSPLFKRNVTPRTASTSPLSMKKKSLNSSLLIVFRHASHSFHVTL